MVCLDLCIYSRIGIFPTWRNQYKISMTKALKIHEQFSSLGENVNKALELPTESLSICRKNRYIIIRRVGICDIHNLGS